MFLFRPLPDGLKRCDASVMAASVFGVGSFRWASGTAGSLAALPLALVLPGPWIKLAGAALAFALGMASIPKIEKVEHDSRIVVIDEVCGQLIALMAARNGNLPDFLAAFLLFRLFDIWKPWPARHFDRNVPGAFGVMMDDVVAGIFAALVLLGIHIVVPSW